MYEERELLRDCEIEGDLEREGRHGSYQFLEFERFL